MQILSWACKKFLNDASSGKEFRTSAAGANDRDTSVETDQRRSNLKNRRAIQISSATDRKRVADIWSRPTLQQYFREDELHQNVLQSAPIYSDHTHPWLLTTSTLGAGELIFKEEMDSKKVSPDVDEVSPTDIFNINEELHKILYTTDGQQLRDDYPARDINVQRQSDEFRDGEQETTGKKNFPLQNFLEIPSMTETPSDFAKKKHVVVRGLSNLLNYAVCSQGMLHQKWKEKVQRIRISPFLLEKLMKIYSMDSGPPPRYRGKLNKFLHFFRKKSAVSDGDNLIANFEENNEHEKSSKCRGNVSGSDGGKLPHHLAHGLEAFETRSCSDNILQQQCCWHLKLDDVQVFKTDNEYWIKTDDEYLVLEL